MPAVGVDLYRHNLWANLRLLEFCATLTDEQLDSSSPGTYGTVRDTLVHLAAEQLYVTLLTHTVPEELLREGEPFVGFEALLRCARRSGEALIEVASSADPTEMLHGKRGDREYAFRAAVPLVQAINHATEHRAHVFSTLTPQGITPPTIDGRAYGRETGLVEELSRAT